MKVLFVIYDNESYIHYFPLGPAYLTATLREQGHDISIYNQDVYRYSEEHLTRFLDEQHFDVVGLGMVAGYYPFRKMLQISEAVKAAKSRPFFVLGGSAPSPEPEYFLRKTGADAVVIGEGEIIMTQLLEALAAGRSLSTVKGVAYWDGDHVHVNERQALISDVDSIPFPAWDAFPMEHYAMMRAPGIRNNERAFQIITGRGCPFSCNFCYRMDPGFRMRSPESVIEEIRFLRDRYQITFFDFVDDLFMFGIDRTINFCEKIIQANLGIRFICEGRLNFATMEVLQALKKAGCIFVNYGIESLDDVALKAMNKNLTVDQIVRGIENTLAVGLHPGLNIIFGNIGETMDVLKKDVAFLLKYNTYAQLRTIRPVTPYPGCALYYHAIEKGLLEGPADFYEKKHVNSDLLTVNFTPLSEQEFYDGLKWANTILVEDYFDKQKQGYLDSIQKLYGEKDTSFRGFRHT